MRLEVLARKLLKRPHSSTQALFYESPKLALQQQQTDVAKLRKPGKRSYFVPEQRRDEEQNKV